MSFSTYEFIFVFFPIMLILYYLAGGLDKSGRYRAQTIVLLSGSLLFIAVSGIPAVLCLTISIIVNYIFIQILKNSERSIPLYIGIVVNILFLGYFKYYNFFIDNINVLLKMNLSLKNIVLPMGISFYTFQQILILVEYNKSEKKQIGFVQYVLCIVLFPKIMSGPIVSWQELENHWKGTKQTLDFNNICAGMYLFCIGLFKKIVVADTLNYFVDNGYEITANIHFWQAWCTSICYTMQIYFDFSGYSDMAIGIAKTFGIRLPINFDSPYHSKSITEFWRKWHITLSKTLSTLIYIPMGGSRKGKFRTCINLMVTFIVSGLWHGASWTFVLWGTFHGMLMVLEKVGQGIINKVPVIIRQITTFFIVNLLWVLFRARDLNQALQIYRGMFSNPLKGGGLSTLSVLADDGIIPFPDILWSLYILLIIVCLTAIILNKKNSNEFFRKFTPSSKTLIFTMVLFVISVLHLSRLASFVYVNF